MRPPPAPNVHISMAVVEPVLQYRSCLFRTLSNNHADVAATCRSTPHEMRHCAARQRMRPQRIELNAPMYFESALN